MNGKLAFAGNGKATHVLGVLQGSTGESVSGGDRYCFEVWRAWATRSDLRLALMTSRLGVRAMETHGYDTPVVQVSTYGERFPWQIRYVFRMIQAALFGFTKARPDIVFAGSAYFYDLIPAIAIKKRWKAFLVLPVFHVIPGPQSRQGRRVHNMIAWIENRVALWFVRRYADLVIVDNPELEQDLIDQRFSSERVFLTKMGVRDFSEARNERSAVHCEALFVGRLTPQKGLEELIDIWRLVCDARPASKLLLVGQRSAGFDIDRHIDELGLSDSVEIVNSASDVQVRQIMQSAGIFVSASREEGYGLSILEALSSGLPCVTYDLPAFQYAFPRGRVSPNTSSQAAMSELIVSLLNDKTRRDRLKDEIADSYSNHRWEEVAFNLLDRVSLMVGARHCR